MKSIKDVNFYNSRVFVRCDFNVPIEQGKILDDFKIQSSLETINYLRKSGAKIILASHLGKPQQVKRKKQKVFSLEPVKKKLEELLDEKIIFSKKIVGRGLKMKIRRMKNGQIILLENLRFDKREEKNDETFARQLADLADSYIGEAFAVCHRKSASMIGLPKLLPHFLGFQMVKEIEALSKISKRPVRPLCVIIGGIKIESKIKTMEKFLKIADHLLLGGKIANIILAVKGISIGKVWPGEKIVKVIEKIKLTDPKIHLPVDVLVSPDKKGDAYIRESAPGSVRTEEENFDIGSETIETFSEIIKSSKTIFWSGPLGFFENDKFSQGTREIAEAIGKRKSAFRVAGGSETVAAIRKFGLIDNFSFISTGGGAMLAFLSGEEMPGLEALK